MHILRAKTTPHLATHTLRSYKNMITATRQTPMLHKAYMLVMCDIHTAGLNCAFHTDWAITHIDIHGPCSLTHATHESSQATQRHHNTHGVLHAARPPPPSHACSPGSTHTHTHTPVWTHTTAWSVTHSHSQTNTNLLLDIFKPRLVLLLWQPPQTHCHSNPTSAFQAPNPGGLQGPNQRPMEGAAVFSAIIRATPVPPP